jgi:hypothetical protein
MNGFVRMRDLDPETQARIKARANELHDASKVLLDALGSRLPPEVEKRLRQYHWVGEWMLMLDDLVASIVRQPIPLTAADRDLLVRTLEITGPNPGYPFDFLRDPRGVLAALTTIDDEGTITPPWPGFEPHTWWPRLRAGSLWGHKGGHLHGIGIPHKTTFPASWDAQAILDLTEDVARNPDQTPIRDRTGGWITRGTRNGIAIESRLRPDGTIANAYPLHGLGLHRNDADGRPQRIDGLDGAPPTDPPDPRRATDRTRLNDLHHRTTTLIDTLAPRLPDRDTDQLHTDLTAGEWLIALDDLCATLIQDHIPITPTEHDALAAALRIGGLGDDDLPTIREPDDTLAALTVTHHDQQPDQDGDPRPLPEN